MFRKRRLLLGVLLATSLVLAPGIADAENQLTRAGTAVGGFFRRVARALIPGGPRDGDLDRALETYAKGSYYTTYLYSTRLRARNLDGLEDEADLLRGLSAAAAGIRDEAVSSLDAVIEAPRVSPYYAVALATLLELETRLGNHRAAAAAASRYFADFWRLPPSAREATIKTVFLETGNLSAMIEPRKENTRADAAETGGGDDRPADRAVYLAGQALLAEKDLEKAEVCFETITPRSPYFPYARYGLAQALYGLKRFEQAKMILAELQSTPTRGRGEPFLKDRAALFAAQMMHEMDEDSSAIAWLGQVSRTGPFALHATLLAAQIHADRDRPALALVYLKDRPEGAAEPKLVARAAALDAALHRDLHDPNQAIAGLERSLAVLGGYSNSLQESASSEAELDRLVNVLWRHQAVRDRFDAWRRQNVSNAVPDLLTASFEPGWLSSLLASALTRQAGADGMPVIYYPRSFDPFSALPAPRERSFDPPADRAFPSLFRRSLGRALSEALRFEGDLRSAVENGDDTHLSFLLLDGALRLAAVSPQNDESIDSVQPHTFGFGESISLMIVEKRARTEILSRALSDAAPLDPAPERHEALAAAATEQLVRWRNLERELLRQALGSEAKAVQDLHYALEFELSQTLAIKKESEKDVLQQGPLAGQPGP